MKSFQYENYIGIRSSNIIQSNSGLIWSSAPTEKDNPEISRLIFPPYWRHKIKPIKPTQSWIFCLR